MATALWTLVSELPVADHPRGPQHDADPGHVDERELPAVEDEVAAGARRLVEDRREPVVAVQVDLAAQVHRRRVTVIPVRLKPG